MPATVNLGDVGFGLVADTSALERSLGVLKTFGSEVDRLSRRIDEAGQRQYTQFARIEKSMTGLFDKVSASSSKLKAVGAASSDIDRLNKSYEGLVKTATSAAGRLDPHELTRGTQGMQAILAQSNRLAKEQELQAKRAAAAQTILFAGQQKVEAAASSFRAKGAPEEYFTKLSTAAKTFDATASKASVTTEQLRNAKRSLDADVNKLTRSLNELNAAQRLAASAETRLFQQRRATEFLNIRAARVGLPGSFAEQNTQALRAFETSVRSGTIVQQAAALRNLQTSLSATRAALHQAGDTGSRLSDTFRALERATILAAGPLSGLGARMAVMSALFDSTSAKLALTIAGVTGVVAGFGILAVSGVRATMQMEKFEALLTSSTGAAVLARGEFNYVAQTADKLGVSVKDIAAPYAKLTTAARLAGFTIEEQRDIFEGLATASSALRLDTAKTSQAFLALEQMISKGKVESQELRQQFGEAIPGAVELAASAIGKTTSEFLNMVTKGEVVTKDFLPKLANLLKITFGPGAVQGAKSLQGELNKLSNAYLGFSEALDKTIGTSNAFKSVVTGTTNVLKFLTENMDVAVKSLVAFGGAVAGAFLGAALLRAPAAIMAVASAVQVLIAAVAGGGVIAALGRLANPIVAILSVAGAAVGVVAGWRAMGSAVESADKATGEYIKGANEWLDVQRKMKESHAQTTDRIIDNTRRRLQAVILEMEGVNKALVAYEVAGQQTVSTVESWTDKIIAALPLPLRVIAQGMKQLGSETKEAIEKALGGEQEEALKKRRKTLEEYAFQLQEILGETQKLAKAPPPGTTTTDKSGKATDNAIKKIRELIETYDKANAMLKATPLGVSGVQGAEAMSKAADLMTDFPAKAKLGEAVKLLNEAGFFGATLKDQIAGVYLATEEANEGFRRWEQHLQNAANAAGDIGRIWKDIRDRQEDLSVLDQDRLREVQEFRKGLEEVTEASKMLGLSTEDAAKYVEEFTSQMRNLQAGERSVAQLRNAFESVKSALPFEEMQKQQKALDQLVARIPEAADVIAYLNKQMGERMAESLLQFNTTLSDVTKKSVEVAKQLTQSFEDFFFDAMQGKFTNLADAFKQTIDRMVAHFLASQLNQWMFGNLTTTGQAGGVFGDILRTGVSFLFGGVGAEQNPAPVEERSLPGRASGGSVWANEPIWVGEHGREVFTPQTNGQITPSHRAGADGSMVVNIYGVQDSRGIRQTSGQAAAQLARVVRWGGRFR